MNVTKILLFEVLDNVRSKHKLRILISLEFLENQFHFHQLFPIPEFLFLLFQDKRKVISYICSLWKIWRQHKIKDCFSSMLMR